MPIISGIRRISPLNLNKNVTIGVAFPLDQKNMFKGTETIQEQNKANLINLLLTYPGERINLPDYGIGLKNLLFEQQVDLENLKENIQQQALIHIPSIQIQDIQTGLSEDEHTIFISLTYTNLEDNSLDGVQLNFN
jgi:phage baseplate assembly protein W